ncbi:MAG: PIN domain-containing protein [Flavobacteriales bacterium]|nr:PIN domain-containing protein [Flavobacteriales bacterium]
MMRVLVDSDVVISALKGDEAQSAACQLLMDALINGEFLAVTTPVIMANIQYVLGRRWAVKRGIPDRPRVVRAMNDLLPLFSMVHVTPAHFYASMASTFVDLEDGLQHFAAIHARGRVDGIVTCNVKDYDGHSQLPVFEPGEFAHDYL